MVSQLRMICCHQCLRMTAFRKHVLPRLLRPHRPRSVAGTSSSSSVKASVAAHTTDVVSLSVLTLVLVVVPESTANDGCFDRTPAAAGSRASITCRSAAASCTATLGRDEAAPATTSQATHLGIPLIRRQIFIRLRFIMRRVHDLTITRVTPQHSSLNVQNHAVSS
jgi:hypothetical protein